MSMWKKLLLQILPLAGRISAWFTELSFVRKTGCCYGLSPKLFEAEKNGKNPRLLIIIFKLKCSCLSQRKELDAGCGHGL